MSMLLLAVIAAFLVMMIFSSRNAKKQQAQRKEQMERDMVPGAWVMTTSGFYGRYVETDGDVVVLETSDGTETLWTSRAIVSVGNPPFAPDETDTDSDMKASEKDDQDSASAMNNDDAAQSDTKEAGDLGKDESVESKSEESDLEQPNSSDNN